MDKLAEKGFTITRHNLHQKFSHKKSKLLQEYKKRLNSRIGEKNVVGSSDRNHPNDININLFAAEQLLKVVEQNKTVLSEKSDVDLIKAVNDINDLNIIKFNIAFFNSIKYIFPIKFHCIYWLTEQQKLWKKLVLSEKFSVT